MPTYVCVMLLARTVLIIQKGTITREVAPDDLGDASLVGEFIGIAT
jgi:branched-chain amino acid transport system ATP-binding protein